MEITQAACDYVKSSTYSDPVIVIFEQEYRG